MSPPPIFPPIFEEIMDLYCRMIQNSIGQYLYLFLIYIFKPLLIYTYIFCLNLKDELRSVDIRVLIQAVTGTRWEKVNTDRIWKGLRENYPHEFSPKSTSIVEDIYE